MMQFPQYESYKDSGVEWLEEIPNDWKLKKIKYSCYVKGRVGWHGLSSNEYSDEGAFLVTGTDLSDGIVNWVSCHHISFQRYEEDKYIQLKENDLLITKDGTIGKLAVVKNLPDKATLNSGIFLVRSLSSKLNILFLKYLLASNIFYKFLDYFQTGATVKHLYQETFGNFQYPLPSLEEQQKIVNFLDQKTAEIDEAIAKKQKLIELLQEQKAILINRAVTKGLNPNVTMRDSGIEWIVEIPEHWEIKKLKHISKVQSGITLGKVYTGNNLVTYPYLRVANVQYGYFALEDVAELTLPEEISNKYFIKPGDILVTEGGDIDKLGRGTVWEGQIEKCLHQNHIFAIHIIQKYASEYFVSLSMGSDYGRKYFTTTGIQTTNLASTNKTKLGNLPILLPPKEEQLKIVDHAQKIEEKYLHIINLTAQEINSLQELKQVMISNAVTGKIKI